MTENGLSPRLVLGESVELVGFGKDDGFVPSRPFEGLARLLHAHLGSIFRVWRYLYPNEGYRVALLMDGEVVDFSVSGVSSVWDGLPKPWISKLVKPLTKLAVREDVKSCSLWRYGLWDALRDMFYVLSAGCSLYRPGKMDEKLADIPSFSSLKELEMKLELRGGGS